MLKAIPVRRTIQALILLYVVYLGVAFYFYVQQFEPGGSDLGLSHPDGVEAFLPIGGLTSLRYFFSTGTVHPLHPAAMVLLASAIIVSIFFKKAFCGWICPVGFISELLYAPWKKLFGHNYQLPALADRILRGTKYLLLFFFVVAIGWLMSPEQVTQFLGGDYWRISDVKMLHFFTRMSPLAMIVILGLAALSFPIRMFWCRFICPYGALLGLFGKLSPFKIRRNISLCHSCGKCTQVCPAHLPVAVKMKISSPECSSCLTCKSACPSGALNYAIPAKINGARAGLTPIQLGGLAIGLFLAFVGLAQLTDNWKSKVSHADLARLIPYSDQLDHPR